MSVTAVSKHPTRSRTLRAVTAHPRRRPGVTVAAAPASCVVRREKKPGASWVLQAKVIAAGVVMSVTAIIGGVGYVQALAEEPLSQSPAAPAAAAPQG